MQRPNKAGGKTRKPRRLKTLRRRHVPKAASQVTGKETNVGRLTRERDEALEQQAATAEVLNVISRSTFDLQTVFNILVETATRLCQARASVIWRPQADENYHLAASYGLSARFKEQLASLTLRSGGRSVVGRSLQTGRTVYVPDLAADPDYASRSLDEFGGYRGLLCVPLMRQGAAIGVLMVAHMEAQEFTEKQISLVTTFADQAVIAIENVRLFEAEQQRTKELSELLSQQTATADVLKVISSSPGALEPVFQVILENAIRICEAKFGHIVLLEGNLFRMAVETDMPAKLAEFFRQRGPFEATPGSHLDRLVRTKQVSRTADDTAEAVQGVAARYGGARSIIAVPMLKDDVLIGAIMIYRQEVRPFTDKQIELVTNFAAQAVIAIENTRLLNELRESLQQQTATADVLKVISSSPGELKPVFLAMLDNATRICEAKFGTLFLYDGNAFRFAADVGAPVEYTDFQTKRGPFQTTPGSQLDQVLKTKRVSHTPDYSTEQVVGVSGKLGGARSSVSVPMLKDGALVGAISIFRQEVRPFTDKQIALLENFASQAVIAIENARLLNELRQRTDDLSVSLEDLRTAQDRLVQTEKLASLGQLTAGIAHEIKNPLNFINNFSSVSVELIDELRTALAGANLDNKRRAEISEIADMLQGNLDKVVQHGKRADSIVKNMLLHSRQGSGEHRPIDINALVEESLNLAYHGARAERQGFNITLEKSFDPAAGEADLFPQEITRVLLNLISNGFYAATKRKAEANGGDYEPKLAAATKNLGDRVEIRIRDNGTGIPREVKDKMFNPFFTTKPAGEGTGLGLSISHDIVVKQHGGSIEVDTKPGEFTEFKIILPRKVASVAKSGEHT